MKVGVYYNNRDIRLEERAIPEIHNNSILLKIISSGICGSDLMEFHRIKKAPLVLGHEIAGIIEKVGEDIKDYALGDRIFATHHVPCDACKECQRGYKTQCDEFKKINNFSPGGFSEYTLIAGRSLETGIIKLPNEMTYDQASFIEPLGTVVETSEKLSGDSVLVLGAGIAGLLNIQLNRVYGAGSIIATDTNEKRLEAAKKFGANYTINAKDYNPSLLKEINNGRKADRVIICTGAPKATEQAFQSYEQGGKIIFFATPPENEKTEIEWYQHWRNKPTIEMTYGASPQSCKTAFELIKNDVIDVENMISHRLPLEKIAEGFTIAAEENCLKVIINPHKK